MGRKGQPKTGGRAAGTPNRKTQDLLDKCEEAGIDPFMALLLIARDGDEEQTRFGALKEICQYLYPKRKAIEHEHNVDKALIDEASQLLALEPHVLAEETEKELRLIKGKKA